MSTAAKGNWHILGAGAQGLLWAAQFARAQLPVQLLLRADALNNEVDGGGDRTATINAGAASQHVDICYEHAGISTVCTVATGAVAPIRRLLVTVKAGDVAGALRGIRALLADDVLLVILANGIGAEAEARAVLPQARILMGTSTHGSYRRDRLHVVHAGVGSIRIGAGESTSEDPSKGPDKAPNRDEGKPPHLGAELIADLPPAMAISWDTHIRERLWRKLAVNACINPLTAVLDCRNGDLLQHEGVQQDWPLLADEAAAVLSAEGIAVSGTELLDELRAVATTTAGNYSSMHQDVAHGRRSENAWITGALLQAARRHGLSLPTHQRWQERLARRCAETGSPG